MPAKSRFDLTQAIVVAAFAALGGMAIPLAALDHWQRVLAGALVGAASGFTGSFAHDAGAAKIADRAASRSDTPR
jgi:hypothetical protein